MGRQTRADECRVCGCTGERACPGGCGWADAERTLCTDCIGAVGPLTAMAERMVRACCDAEGGRTIGLGLTEQVCQDVLCEMESLVMGPDWECSDDSPPAPLLLEAVAVCEQVEYAVQAPGPARERFVRAALRRARALRRRITGRPAGSPLQLAARRRNG